MASELDALRSLRRRAVDLAASHLEALDVFYLASDLQPLTDLRHGRVKVHGFAHLVPPADLPRDGTARESLASTARCIRSLQVCPDIQGGNADYGGVHEAMLARYENEELTSYGLYHMNPFTLGQVLPVLRETIEGPVPEAMKAMVDDAAEHLARELEGEGVSVRLPVDHDPPTPPTSPHGFLTYRALSSLADWDRLERARARPSLRWSEAELYRQVCLFAAGNDERSDAFQLGYNLLVQHRFNRFGVGNSLIDLSLRTLFGAQLERGVWEKRDPLFRYGDRGDAYCFSFEMLASLLRQFRDEWEFLSPHEEHLTAALEWAERNVMLDHGPPLWRSGHAVQAGMPESWATAEVYSFLQLYASYLSWRMETIILGEFRGRPAQQPNPHAFDDLFEPEIRLPGEDHPAPLSTLLKERLLDPLRMPGERVRYSLVHQRNPTQHPRSGILFGPPGTGKTSYVKKVAEYLGWPMVSLDPSDFASEGLHLVAPVAGEVFSKLLELEDTVVFFDEMDSLLHTRADGDGDFERVFLTTSFLPKLQELADRAASLFFVATNHYSTIDPAARRPGRFDFRLQMLPPSYEEKLRMARKILGEEGYARLEADLRREPYRNDISLATRAEMLKLLDDLRRQPDRAEQLLSGFHAELSGDEKVVEEQRYNSFDRLI